MRTIVLAASLLTMFGVHLVVRGTPVELRLAASLSARLKPRVMRPHRLKPSGIESLDAVGRRVAKALYNGDWNAFRKDACPSVRIGEYWAAEDMFLTSHAPAPALGSDAPRYLVYLTVVKSQPNISKDNRKVFDGFCHEVRKSYEYRSPLDWPPDTENNYNADETDCPN